jgi:NRAMP (natural resistance-associated macrophage protein)-like metal ion transporter
MAVPQAGVGSREAAVRRLPPFVRFFRILGPGLITGASDDDPSGVGTYAVTGASTGFSLLWTMIIMIPMMVAAQLISAKIAMTSGMGLSGVLRKHYPRTLLYVVIAAMGITNTLNAGADIGAIAAAIRIMVPVPMTLMVLVIAAVLLVFQIWGSYRLIVVVFKGLTLIFFAYIGSAVLARPATAEVLRGTLVPYIRPDVKFLSMLVALLGTTISPYMWFWQANQEVEERIAMGQRRLWQRRGASDTELRYATWDVTIGMIFSNLIAYFIILATAATLFEAGKTEIQSAAQAAEALRPLAGNAAGLLFALGLLASGFLAVPVLTGSTAYAVAEGLGWNYGLDQKARRAVPFYAVIAAATLIGLFVNFIGLNPIDALFIVAVINGFLTPPLLIVIMLISNNRAVMGNRVNGVTLNVVGWATAAATLAAAVAFVFTLGKS